MYVRDRFDGIELNDCNDKVQCFWVKMRGESQQDRHPAGSLL